MTPLKKNTYLLLPEFHHSQENFKHSIENNRKSKFPPQVMLTSFIAHGFLYV